ncbi:hypothetical protein DWX02_13575 [Parabacteroides distasonis]|jgi:hypothetical protein|uniref:hypothetical protein n=1 Tax=Parabacteroides distasonis TaxID=823 RepID=UPI000EFD445E|nr:hypothetical protein [Parabacteroides distasonis]RGT93947.1 hypothetical protein DWX02_13575 [Parabacteroides distasonis]
MSKIDKRQTVEEAAKDYAIGKTFFRKNVLKEVDADDYVLRKDNCREDFKAGAEWQAKQSPWVSIKERLPKENEMVLCRMVSNGAIVSGYIVVEAGKPPRVATSGNFEFEDYGDYECDMWMPIPDLEE